MVQQNQFLKLLQVVRFGRKKRLRVKEFGFAQRDNNKSSLVGQQFWSFTEGYIGSELLSKSHLSFQSYKLYVGSTWDIAMGAKCLGQGRALASVAKKLFQALVHYKRLRVFNRLGSKPKCEGAKNSFKKERSLFLLSVVEQRFEACVFRLINCGAPTTKLKKAVALGYFDSSYTKREDVYRIQRQVILYSAAHIRQLITHQHICVVRLKRTQTTLLAPSASVGGLVAIMVAHVVFISSYQIDRHQVSKLALKRFSEVCFIFCRIATQAKTPPRVSLPVLYLHINNSNSLFYKGVLLKVGFFSTELSFFQQLLAQRSFN